MNKSSDFRSRGGRLPGLDVMRAVAIAMVLVNHWIGHFSLWFGYPTISPLWDFAGDAGVELFFALSGFLIGRILLDMRPDWRNLRIFLIRRALRTLPLYFVWLALLLCVFPPVGDVVAIGLRYATLTQNLIAPLPANYYFAVSWSLAVEEWFYLLSGGAMVVLARAFGRRRAVWCYLALFLLAPLAPRLLHENWRALVPFRLDEIACGVAFALLYRRQSRIFRHPWLALALGLSLMRYARSLSSGAPCAYPRRSAHGACRRGSRPWRVGSAQDPTLFISCI